jgi:hypothetical protein
LIPFFPAIVSSMFFSESSVLNDIVVIVYLVLLSYAIVYHDLVCVKIGLVKCIRC